MSDIAAGKEQKKKILDDVPYGMPTTMCEEETNAVGSEKKNIPCTRGKGEKG